jgi:hypothetical protein
MTDKSFQDAIATMCGAMVIIVAGFWILNGIDTAVSNYENRTNCNVNPSYCFPRR